MKGRKRASRERELLAMYLNVEDWESGVQRATLLWHERE
jgi:hypothetical protein